MKILVQFQQVKAGKRAFGDVGLAHGGLESALPRAAAPCRDEIAHDFLGLAQDLEIRIAIQGGTGCDIGPANDHRLVAGAAEVDDMLRVITLWQHPAGHHHVGPAEVLIAQVFGIAIDQPDIPFFGQQGRNRNQAKRRGRITRTGQITGFLVIPE